MADGSKLAGLVGLFGAYEKRKGGQVDVVDLVEIIQALDPGAAWEPAQVEALLRQAGATSCCDGGNVDIFSSVNLELFLRFVLQGPLGRETKPAPGKETLASYYLSQAYAFGEPLPSAGEALGGYVLLANAYEHEESGCHVWKDALEICPAESGGEDLRVFFHYTGHTTFDMIVAAPVFSADMLAVLQQRIGSTQADSAEQDGRKFIYVSALEPAMLPADVRGSMPKCCIPIVLSTRLAVQNLQDHPMKPQWPETWAIDCSDAPGILQNYLAGYEKRLRRIVQVREEQLGPSHMGTIAAITNLVFFMESQDNITEAIRLYRDLLRISKEAYGNSDPSTLTNMANLAYLVERSGDLQEAEALSRVALQRRELELGAYHEDTLTSVYNLAQLLQGKGELEEAESLFRRELAWCEATYGSSSWQTRESRRNLAKLTRARAGAKPSMGSKLSPPGAQKTQRRKSRLFRSQPLGMNAYKSS